MTSPPVISPIGCKLIPKFGNYTEIAAAATQSPEEIGMRVGAGLHNLTSGEHDLSADQAIARRVREPASRLPIPPPRVSPPMPVVEIAPPVAARLWAVVAWSKSAQVVPPWARAVLASGSTVTCRIGLKSMTRPSAMVPSPEAL